MQTALTARELDQAAFEKRQDASAAEALKLKRHGYESRAVANGESITATGRMLTMVKKKVSAAFAFLTGSNNLITQLALADAFQNSASLGNVWNTIRNWGANFSEPVDTEVTDSPTEILQEFAMEAACERVVAELQAQELAFETDLEDEFQKVFHEAGDFIGPLQELEHVHERVQSEHRLKQIFNPDGMHTYAHCVGKVCELKTAFASSNTETLSIASPSQRVMVYNSAASASSEAPAPTPRKTLGVEAPHLEPTACPA